LDTLELIQTIDAHDAEIMELCFATVGDQLILASASRDRLIHIFGITLDTVQFTFELLQTIDDHTSTLTSMMFVDGGTKLISCGADKAVIFRNLQNVTIFNVGQWIQLCNLSEYSP
jgi:WD40 repeat protein